MRAPRASFGHLLDLSDEIGPLSHADHAQPRRQHGYATGDMARLVVAVTRQSAPGQAVTDLGLTGLRFLRDAQAPDGQVHDRRESSGAWEGTPAIGEGWGLSTWAWGTVVRLGADARIRRQATACFRLAATHRPDDSRSMAFAALGAAEVLAARPHYDDARALLVDAVDLIGPARDDDTWPWPEDRLTHANAVVCEVLLVAGDLFDRPELTRDGLVLLEWLLARQTHDGHLSPTPSVGAGRGDAVPAFPQQPVEVATLADACAAALRITGEPSWRVGLDLARGWFAGHNDLGALMWDPETDGSFSGLHAAGPVVDQDAGSTLALLTTFQHDRGKAPA